MDPTSGHLVSIMEACEIAGVSRRTIYNWLNAGKLQYVRTAGGSVRIAAESLFLPADGAVESAEADARIHAARVRDEIDRVKATR